MRTRVILFFMLVMLAGKSYSQNPVITSITEKMKLYGTKVPQSALFVHFDKTVYTNNELVWFTAYLLRSQESGLYHTLSVALIKNDDRSVLLEYQYLMSKGLAMGDMRLPDSIATGNYSFIAYTNRVINGKPEDVFIQPITIKTTKEPPFTASLRIIDSIGADGYLKVQLEGYTKERALLAGALVNYSAGAGKDLSGTGIKTDIKGEYLFRIPVKQVNEQNSMLSAKVTFGKDSRELKIRLPVPRSGAVVKFYPEGGYLVNGLQGYVGWEVTTPAGSPLSIYGALYKNGIPIDTIQTNSLGLGRFVLHPDEGAAYSIKLLDTAWSKSMHPLPGALKGGKLLTVKDAVVNDTLRMTIRGTEAARLTLLVHNFREIHLSASLDMQSLSQVIKLPLTDVPKGLNTITLLDNQGRPLAERLFFAHYNKRELLSISPDKPEYATREKVTISLQLKDQSGKASMGVLSLACVQETRLEVLNNQDIESYIYLGHELNTMPVYPAHEIYESKSYLENLLLVKGWRKYTWAELVELEPKDTLAERSSLFISGTVTKLGKPLKSPSKITLIGGTNFDQISTDSIGHFIFPYELMVLNPDKKVLVSVNEKRPENFNISVHNPYQTINKTLAELINPGNNNRPAFAASTQSLLLNRNERTITMGEIKLTAKKDGSLYATNGLSNACGDYVCPYNILNCPNHYGNFGNKLPVEGRVYTVNGSKMPYEGCVAPPKNENILGLAGIYTNREFYGSDYSKDNSELPEYFSTIYWTHGLLLSADGTAKLSFYTSDITGNYKVIVQGMSPEDVIYAEYTFPVKKKKP